MMSGSSSDWPRFVADTMLGRLARWLRFLGYDVSYPEVMEDGHLLDIARSEGRILLTRDKMLVTRARSKDMQSVLVGSDDIRDQLAQVFGDMGLTKDGALSRCSVCNVLLEKARKADVRGHVPDGALELHDEFWRCTRCGRYYWEGTHVERIKKEIDGL